MSRDLTAGMSAAVTADRVEPVLFYEGEFASGTIRLWTGIGEKVWNGQTWTGAGRLLGIEPVEETSEIRAVPLSVSLSMGLNDDQLQIALAQCRNGLPGSVWLGALDATGAVIVDPYLSFSGRLDVPDIVDAAVETKIVIRYESRLIDLERIRARRYTSEDQAIDHPGDRGCDYVPSLQDAQIPWGR
jgi:hypothetical protein